jgi:phenol 2-monooxygenase
LFLKITMARNPPPFTWANGFQEPLTPSTQPAWADQEYYTDIDGATAHYTPPQQDLRATTSMGTAMGVEQLPGWPEIYDGTMGKVSKSQNGDTIGNEVSNGVEGEKTSEKVDVLICGGKKR